MELKIKPLSPKIGADIPFPSYATPGSAGMDLRACIDAPITIQPRERVKVPTGLGNNYGVTLPNCVGVVDSDYRGEVIVGLTNLSDEAYTIQPGDRVAQLVIMPVAQANITVTDTLDDTERGAGGFGSTGRQ